MVGKVQTAEVEGFNNNDATIVLDRRKKSRQMAIFRLAKVESGLAEGWGFIKNISNSGVMLEIHPGFTLGDTATVALTDEVALAGEIRWRKGPLVGIQFSNDINATELLANLRIHNKSKPARLPRVRMNQSIVLRIGLTIMRGDIYDISPGGMRINTPHLCQIGSQLTLSVPALGDIIGTVRWQKNNHIGIKFQERVSVPQLTDWLANYYSTGKS